jgi:hypothetical protein
VALAAIPESVGTHGAAEEYPEQQSYTTNPPGSAVTDLTTSFGRVTLSPEGQTQEQDNSVGVIGHRRGSSSSFDRGIESKFHLLDSH